METYMLDVEEGVGLMDEAEAVEEIDKVLTKQQWDVMLAISLVIFSGNARKEWQILQKVKGRMKNTGY